MNKHAEKALRESIKHWEEDVLKKGVLPNTDNCPLCNLHRHCCGCPVYKKTRTGGCMGTPYVDYDKHMEDCAEAEYIAECTRRELAQKEIAFLKSLLPENQKGEDSA